MGNALGSERGKGPDSPSEIPLLFLKPFSRTKALLIYEGQRGASVRIGRPTFQPPACAPQATRNSTPLHRCCPGQHR
eukprot:4900266-Pyramimonas_sp.AAC.2